MTTPDNSGGNPANADQGQGGQGGNSQLFTQEFVDHQAAQARRGAVEKLFRDAGVDKPLSPEQLKTVLAAANAHQEAEAANQPEITRLNSELSTARENAAKVPTLEAQLLRAQLAGDAGLKSRYHKYVEGTTAEEIQESIKLVLADVGGGGTGGGEGEQPPAGQPQQQQSGTGAVQGLTPNPQQGTPGGGTQQPKASMQSGAEAYAAKHGKKKE